MKKSIFAFLSVSVLTCGVLFNSTSQAGTLVCTGTQLASSEELVTRRLILNSAGIEGNTQRILELDRLRSEATIRSSLASVAVSVDAAALGAMSSAATLYAMLGAEGGAVADYILFGATAAAGGGVLTYSGYEYLDRAKNFESFSPASLIESRSEVSVASLKATYAKVDAARSVKVDEIEDRLSKIQHNYLRLGWDSVEYTETALKGSQMLLETHLREKSVNSIILQNIQTLCTE